MAFNFSKKPIQIQSRKTGKLYTLIRADGVSLNDASVNQITKVCNESMVYNNVFSDIFKGKQYSEDNARTFTKLIAQGWIDKNRFDWLILHHEVIVGTIGIKSLEGEIGYWQSSEHAGVMTRALKSICSQASEAGFPFLWAYVKKANTPSIKVLEGAGFKLDTGLTAKGENVYGYRIGF